MAIWCDRNARSGRYHHDSGEKSLKTMCDEMQADLEDADKISIIAGLAREHWVYALLSPADAALFGLSAILSYKLFNCYVILLSACRQRRCAGCSKLSWRRRMPRSILRSSWNLQRRSAQSGWDEVCGKTLNLRLHVERFLLSKTGRAALRTIVWLTVMLVCLWRAVQCIWVRSVCHWAVVCIPIHECSCLASRVDRVGIWAFSIFVCNCHADPCA